MKQQKERFKKDTKEDSSALTTVSGSNTIQAKQKKRRSKIPLRLLTIVIIKRAILLSIIPKK